MAEYHVKVNSDGEIIAGTVSKTGKFTNSSVVTREALEAVKDHLLIKTQKENKDIAFGWEYPNKNVVLFLKLEQKPIKELKEEKGE